MITSKMEQPTHREIVLDHLTRSPYITDAQAAGLYGIGQLASVIFRLRKQGYKITTTKRAAVKPRATFYAEYRLEE